MNEHATLNHIDYAVCFAEMALALFLGFAVAIEHFINGTCTRDPL